MHRIVRTYMPVDQTICIHMSVHKGKDIEGEGETFREAIAACRKALDNHVPDEQRLADILGIALPMAAE